MTTFFRTGDTQPNANAHAGAMGGGATTESLVWTPSSGTTSPTYEAAVVDNFGAYALDSPNQATIGSLGLVPEPSSLAIVGLGAAAVLFRRSRHRQ